jgi:deoxyribodipyrimidine photo-lyase
LVIERMHDLNQKEVTRGSYVLYWMQQSKRVIHNPALAYAVEQANAMKLPLVALFVVPDILPESNRRNYQFGMDGLANTITAMEANQIEFFIVLGNMLETVERWVRKAALLVTDTGYLRIYQNWNDLIAMKADCKMVRIEGDVLIPVEQVYHKEAYNAKILRNRIYSLLPDFDSSLVTTAKAEVKLPDDIRKELTEISNRHGDILADNSALKQSLSRQIETFLKKVDHTVNPTKVFRGGYDEAVKHLRHFTDELLADYYQNRNNPAVDYQSNLSPYLHYGQISIREVLKTVFASLELTRVEFFHLVFTVKPGQHKDNRVNGALEFFEEAVVRRELGVNFCHFNDDYDQYNGIPKWARETLREHSSDHRPYLYDLPALEKAETHDPYWNAAQQEMLKTGKMHGYMRMYWGKKLIEWCREPEEAFQIAIYLNNKYQLDGRDPNSYAGVAWCFGKHDRAWPPFPVYGTVRTMTENGLKRKYDIQKYIDRIESM